MGTNSPKPPQIPQPLPGATFLPPTFNNAVQASQTCGYLLNHTALQIRSASASFEFYVDFLGMALIFATHTGLFTVYYLGYPQDGDEYPVDMLRSNGLRSGLLELVLENHNEQKENESLGHATNTFESKERHISQPFGFAHLGFRVPDVQAALKRAEARGFRVLKWPDDVEPGNMPLPSWENTKESSEEMDCKREWHREFLKVFRQIGFVEDPDGNCIEILPREIEQTLVI